MSNLDSASVSALLSAERFLPYLVSASGDEYEAISLYHWNSRANAEIMHLTGMIEVFVRNAIDTQLARWARRRGDHSWFDSVPLDAKGIADLARARVRARQISHPKVVHGRVIAELSFGFWRYLVTPRYQASLWAPAIRRAFPGGNPDMARRRIEVDSHLGSLLLLRNRAAHHEPNHRRNLLDDHHNAVELASWIDPAAAAWITDQSMIPEIFAAKPTLRARTSG